MKIMFVIPSMQAGGAERVTAILSNEFCASGHEVSIECTASTKKVAYELHPNVRLEQMRMYGLRSVSACIRSIRSMRQTIQEQKPDIVVSFFNATCVLCAIACGPLHIPVVFSERNDPRKIMRGWKNQVYQFLLVRMVKHAVFQTAGARNLYPESFTRNARVILNPVDSEQMPPPHKGERTKRIVTVGRLFEQKRHDLLINAFASIREEFPDYIVQIYGKGPLEQETRCWIRYSRLEDCVFLMGEQNDVFQRIKDASLFVMTSDFEGLPNALMEAMALGLPCVSTRCAPGGAEELMMNGLNGLLVPCGEIAPLAEAMRRVLGDSRLAKRLGLEASHLRKTASARSIAAHWLDYFKEILRISGETAE